ncbi:MAG: hypothetical protein AB7T06_29205, partial [Kofleriaceae bacterium]
GSNHFSHFHWKNRYWLPHPGSHVPGQVGSGVHVPRTLTAHQESFVDAFAACGQGVEACKRAGYTGTPATLATQASRNLRHAAIRAALIARGVEIPEVADENEAEDEDEPLPKFDDPAALLRYAMNDPRSTRRDRILAAKQLEQIERRRREESGGQDVLARLRAKISAILADRPEDR